MGEISSEEIERLRKEWQRAEHDHAQWDLLLVKRNELEDQILQMRDRTTELAVDEKELLQQAQRKKQEIDHLLDQYEESSPERIDDLQERLIQAILFLYPDQQSKFDQWKTVLQINQEQQESLKSVIQICEQLIDALEKIKDMRLNVRRRGILSYIFGENPNAKIAQSLQKAEEISQSALEDLKEKNQFSDFLEFLISFHRQCQQHWGFRKLDTVFLPALEMISAFRDQFQSQLNQLLLTQKNFDAQIHAWLEQ